MQEDTMQHTVLNGYLTKDELANQLRITVRTLDNWDRRGSGPPRFKCGKTILYSQVAVDRWLAKGSGALVEGEGGNTEAMHA